MKSLSKSIVLSLLIILIAPVAAFCQSASQICIPTKAFDGLVEDSYKATKFEGLYNDEVETSTTLRKEASQSSSQISYQKQELEQLTETNVALGSKNNINEGEVRRLAKKVNHLKGVVHLLEGAGTILLVLVIL